MRIRTLLACALVTVPTLAQQPTPQLQEAERIFHQGEVDYEAHRYALAAEEFERAYGLMGTHPRAFMVLYNVGMSLEELPGREADAIARLEQFLREVNPNDPEARQMIETAQRDLRELRARSPAGGAELPLVGMIVAASGIGALVAGAIMGGLVLSTDGQIAGMCTNGVCPISVRGLAQQRQDFAVATDVLMISGLAISIGGAVVSLIQVLSGPSPRSTTVTAACGPQGCELSLAGTF
jgi:hypothetical protein